ncbi:MAG: hypothetical protein ACFFET_11780 [Candidatus Thorarchaeota archaeon]
MKRLLIVLAIGIALFLSGNTSNGVQIAPKFPDVSSFTLAQEPIGINFTSPVSSEHLSGNITIKVNATVIAGASVMLRWYSDSWINITDLYNSTSRLYEYPMDVSCLPSGNTTFEVKQVTSHGTAQAFVEAYIDWDRPPILIVDDYGNETVTSYYTDALEDLGFSNGSDYNLWRTQISGSPDDTVLLGYQFVIWFTSDHGNPLSLDERNDIETYLLDATDRKMLLTGTEIAWSAYNFGSFETWLSSNFGVNGYIGDGSNSETLVGSVGGPYAGVSYTYGGGDGSRAGGGADWVRTMEFSQGVIEYQSSGYDEYAATLSPSGNGLFFGFALDAISNSSGRVDLLNRTLSNFGLYHPPEVNVIAPSNGSLVNSPLDLEWSSISTIPVAFYEPSYSIFVDGQLNASGISSETYSIALEHGNHTIRIICEDNYGQRGYANVSIECDLIPPLIEVVSHEIGSVLKGNTLLDFDIIDDHLQSVMGRWDSYPLEVFPAPYHALLPAGDGSHTFTVIAFDRAGNMNSRVFAFTCDDTRPSIVLADLANGSVLMSDTTIKLDIDDMHFESAEYHWDLNGYTELILPFEVTLPADEGVHDLYINVTDIVGNYRIAHYQFTTDDTAPTISLLGLENGTFLKSASSMNLIITDLHPKNVSYQWDSSAPVSYDSISVVLYTPPSENEHWLFVNATDEAGNRASTSFMFIVDNTAPEITLISPLEGSSISAGTEVTVGVSDLNLESVHYKWDSGSWNEWSSPFVTFSPAESGYHALFVNATDLAGNRVQAVFVFNNEDISTTTTPSPTSPTEPQLDLSASLGIMGIGVYLGIIIGIFVWPRLRGKRPSAG